MRRSDDVFFFTLIDFLLQVFFFGLLLFVVGQSLQKEKESVYHTEQQEVERLKKTAGVTNITELTDALTKMAPLKELRGTSDFMQRNGGIKNVEAAVNAASAAGGVDKVASLASDLKATTERLAKVEGWGKVSCIPNVTVNGKIQPKSIATVFVSDKSIRLEEPTPEMHAVLQSLGLEFESVRELGLAEFRKTFSSLIAKHPECRYFLRVITQTQFLDPMRVVWSAFRTQ
jgi:membrane-associated protease RseP (regulator of RpoE activity)